MATFQNCEGTAGRPYVFHCSELLVSYECFLDEACKLYRNGTPMWIATYNFVFDASSCFRVHIPLTLSTVGNRDTIGCAEKSVALRHLLRRHKHTQSRPRATFTLSKVRTKCEPVSCPTWQIHREGYKAKKKHDAVKNTICVQENGSCVETSAFGPCAISQRYGTEAV